VISVTRGDQTILLDGLDGRHQVLTGVGSRVWQLLSERAVMPAVVSRLADEYDAPAGAMEIVVFDLVLRLRAAGFLTAG